MKLNEKFHQKKLPVHGFNGICLHSGFLIKLNNESIFFFFTWLCTQQIFKRLNMTNIRNIYLNSCFRLYIKCNRIYSILEIFCAVASLHFIL